ARNSQWNTENTKSRQRRKPTAFETTTMDQLLVILESPEPRNTSDETLRSRR
ncbi:hypothetical protein LTR59_018397, partial [Friedmanniomyces endolithicus]